MNARRLGAFVVSASALALEACGNGVTLAPDAGASVDGGASGDRDRADSDVRPATIGDDGSGTFTVTATLSVTAPAGEAAAWSDFPRQQTFTLVVALPSAVVGALGRASAVRLESPGARAFKTAAPISVFIPFARSCGGSARVDYDELSFSIQGGRLVGTGRGTAQYIVGDVATSAPLSATLAGGPDADLPTIIVPAASIDPMAGGVFLASEPLVEDSAASLIGSGGDVFALGAQVSEGPPRFTTSFVRSPLMLNWGSTYEVTTEALTDFALHVGDRQNRPRVVTPPAPPLAAEDGFESVTTPTFGGAGVLKGEPLTPLAGTTSLILNTGFGGGFGFLPYMLGSSLAVRLPIHDGDTVVRFSARLVGTYPLDQVSFYGDLRLGVPGREVTTVSNFTAKGLVKVTLPRDGDIYLGPVTTVEVPLPRGAIGEASFEIVGQTAGCGVPPPPSALVIDDLRVE